MQDKQHKDKKDKKEKKEKKDKEKKEKKEKAVAQSQEKPAKKFSCNWKGGTVERKLSPKGCCELRHKLHVVKHMQAVKKKRSQTAAVEQKKILLKNPGKITGMMTGFLCRKPGRIMYT